MSELSVIHRLLDLMIGEKRRPEALGGQDETTRTLHADMQALPEKIAQSLHGSTNGVGGAANKPIALGGGDLPVKPEAPGILEALGDMNVPFVKEFMTGQARLKKLGVAWKSWRAGPEPGVLPDSLDQVKVLGSDEQQLSLPSTKGHQGLPTGQQPLNKELLPQDQGLPAGQQPLNKELLPPEMPEPAEDQSLPKVFSETQAINAKEVLPPEMPELAEGWSEALHNKMKAYTSRLEVLDQEKDLALSAMSDKSRPFPSVGDKPPSPPPSVLGLEGMPKLLPPGVMPEATHSLGASPLPEASTGTARNTENKEQQEELVEALEESTKVTGELNESIKKLIRDKEQQGHAGINQQQGVLPIDRRGSLAAANTDRGVEVAMKAASVFGEVPPVL